MSKKTCTLMFILKSGGYIPVPGCPVSYASDIIRSWYSMREHASSIQPHEGCNAREMLAGGTFAANFLHSDPEWADGQLDVCIAAVAWSEVVGMYLQFPPPEDNTRKRMAEVGEKLADLAEKEMKDHRAGEEWKGDGDGETD